MFVFETLHVSGTAILFLVALPQLNSMRAILATHLIAFIPSILMMLSDFGEGKMVNVGIDALAMLLQLICIIVWTVLEMDTMTNDWSLPVGLILISFGWWESYVTEDGMLKVLWKIKDRMSDLNSGPGEQELIDRTVCGMHVQILADDPKKKANARGPTYFFISLWKIGFFLMLMSTILKEEGILTSYSVLYTDFTKAFETLEYRLMITSTGSTNYLPPIWNIELLRWEKLWEGPAGVIVVQILCSWILYSLAKFANRCRIHYCFALPMTLVTPVCLFTLAPLCSYRLDNPCAYTSTFPDHLFFQCPADKKWVSWMGDDYVLWLFAFISFCWISSQIWRAPNIILADTSKIFSKLYYHGLLVDTCLMLNRRNENFKKPEERNPKPQLVKGCATMWHESSEEIKVCLKSLFKMDEDYCVRKLREGTYDQFEWEAHVFFDDCMKKLEDKWKGKLKDKNNEKKDGKKGDKDKVDDTKWVVNDYVLDLLTTVDEYGTQWYDKIGVNFPKPKKMLTPYGGRLTWEFPGGTSMVVHLKDKSKIRNKKRYLNTILLKNNNLVNLYMF